MRSLKQSTRCQMKRTMPLIPTIRQRVDFFGLESDMSNNTITVFDVNVKMDSEGRYCLNDIHRAAMGKGYANNSQRPSKFLSSDQVKEFIKVLDSKARISALKTVRGGVAGSYGVKLLAMKYAAWIDPSFEVQVYDIFDRVVRRDEKLTSQLIEGQTNPEVSKRLAARAQGKVVRHAMTDTLKAHGVNGKGYAQCTNAIYTPLLGGSASMVRRERGLTAKANLRDSMDRLEIAATMLAEELATRNIENKNVYGNTPCAKECGTAARKIKSIL